MRPSCVKKSHPCLTLCLRLAGNPAPLPFPSALAVTVGPNTAQWLHPLSRGYIYRGSNIYLQISAGWVSGGRDQTLSSGAQQQDKGQWAQTEAEEAPAEHEEELLPSEGDGALAQAA